ncbi:holin [Streptomyces sp. H10-C2]|uniref:holin n=1 Tax=unclassified Streptomyces TaxID=2593676 RepID=UPI0024B9CA93|nr:MULTISPECIES: holin [unclassified Streptomyces]MDJ0345238.1 holin [Streptomyces sp. PH10-H1]MDJ0368816.1 holin [Streptomyces sp. H10-C2]
MANAPVETKVTAATAAAYLASTGLLASLTAVQDNSSLVGWMPGALAPFVLSLVPTAITFIASWGAKHSPRAPLTPPPTA